MGHNTHEDVARRWVSRILTPGREALSSRNLHDRGDRIDSYGSHFEVGRILRNRKGEPVAWLLNGDRWPGVVTTRHQNEVLNAVRGTGLPRLTVPHSALESASIDRSSIEIVDVQEDWWTTTTITKEHLVGSWEYAFDYSEPYGWRNSLTGEYREREGWESAPVEPCEHDLPGLIGPWATGWNWERMQREEELRKVHQRLHHGVWEDVRPHRRNTGHRIAKFSTNIAWELVDDPTAPLGYVFQREVMRHWLGASLFRAQVTYQAQVRHEDCNGTGVASEPWFTWGRAIGIGPLTEQDMYRHESGRAHEQRRFDRGDISEMRPGSWYVDTANEHTHCRGCNGRGRVGVSRRRWAYFLSGFDTNETRPSYFLCELPPKARPTTVEEAYETLKPQAVKLAEQAGRDVKRQGDIFAIPMPGLTLRDLKAQGGRHEKRGMLLGTNHQASEVVRVGRQTYARGVLRHVPVGRRPDHKQLSVGREWHLIQKNTVPVGS